MIRYEDLTAWDRELLLNGCGPQGMRWFDVPDLIFGGACDRHDLAYRIGGLPDMPDGDSAARHYADLEFRRAMIVAAEQAGWLVRWWYRSMAQTYYRAVSRFGADSFEYRANRAPVTLQQLREEERDRQRHGVRRASPLACAMRARGSWA